MPFQHTPVLPAEVIRYLAPRPQAWYLDGTVGGAGHSLALMETTGGQANLICMDQDPAALAAARRRLAPYLERVALVRANFRHLPEIASAQGVLGELAGVLLDIGVSSYQLEAVERGFSYRDDAPLDMRMDPGAKLTAADILNEYSGAELARIFWEYGEERWGKRIAGFVVERRRRQPFSRSSELVEIVKAAIPAGARQVGGHPAKRTFQALRIAVNDELGVLQEGLAGALAALAPGGRVVVISFHSLEDRLVKRFFAAQATGCICPPDL
ncbi:MAG: 16S rRNA (cytosine(1402)-N(4))-methyltransferase RsmH, partial [Heliobacteriaceae bacterium]|nr:16S rRNA (cytosine(1402)-N(4))-methyltransferase RsmH [Heliobacteriaceae bacterium]